MRRGVWIAPLGILSFGVAACSAGPLTGAHLQASMVTTFTNLWEYQQSELGDPARPPAALETSVACVKGLPGSVQHGPGANWVCHVTWLVGGAGTPVTATYNVNLQTDGCYTADGDGPASVNGSATITDTHERTRVNPLFEFNGCVDTS